LLCNVYLHRLDRQWSTREHGVLVRYADDVLVMCKSHEQAEAALQRLRQLLAELGLQPKETKTRIVHLQVDGEGVDVLGFHHRLVTSRPRDGRRPFTFLARWPANKAMQHARDRIRELTARRRLLLPVEVIVQDVNAFLRGWAGRTDDTTVGVLVLGNGSARRLRRARDVAVEARLVARRRPGTGTAGTRPVTPTVST